MNCEHVQEKLYDLLFDLLDDDERREVEAHLETCEACRQARDQAARERELLGRWTVPEPPPGLAESAIAAAHTAADMRPHKKNAALRQLRTLFFEQLFIRYSPLEKSKKAERQYKNHFTAAPPNKSYILVPST